VRQPPRVGTLWTSHANGSCGPCSALQSAGIAEQGRCRAKPDERRCRPMTASGVPCRQTGPVAGRSWTHDTAGKCRMAGLVVRCAWRTPPRRPPTSLERRDRLRLAAARPRLRRRSAKKAVVWHLGCAYRNPGATRHELCRRGARPARSDAPRSRAMQQSCRAAGGRPAQGRKCAGGSIGAADRVDAGHAVAPETITDGIVGFAGHTRSASGRTATLTTHPRQLAAGRAAKARP
jgi:hypothetical protein